MNNLIFKTMELDIEISRDELIKKLSEITDEDFNGNNGEEYYIDGKSELEYDLDNLYDRGYNTNNIHDLTQVVEYIIISCYGNECYYKDLEYKTINIDNEKIIICFATIEIYN